MKKKYLGGISFYVLLFVIILVIFTMLNYKPEIEEISYSDMIAQVKSQNVTAMVIEDRRVTITLNQQPAKYPDDNKRVTSIPSVGILYANAGEEIQAQMDSGKLTVTTPPPAEYPWWVSILPTLLTVGVFVVFWFVFMRQAQGGGKVMSFGKSKARMSQSGLTNITFKDVAGADEEKEELEEIVDFLSDPSKFTALGARIPKGVLLVGPPGTGKTLLAKAVAGEAKVPFFSISGSDFVEMFVGVGASRVRDLFEQAKKNSPSIIFIDEIDAVGRHRGAGLGGGHDEREQTLNQLLVEMDGFGANEGIIIIAATNRPDILDPALLRPGRFDRQVVVNRPDCKGREEILKVHSRKKPLEEDVDLEVVAKGTPGFTGADLENLMNEAALLAAKQKKKKISNQNIQDSIMKVMIGPEKRSKTMIEKERKLTAYHEAGHALATRLLPDADPVHEISIIQRGRAGGYTLHLPKEDVSYVSKNQMLDELVIYLGGRIAEKLILNDISTGASNDLERATKIARDMVMRYGMSDNLGPMTFGSDNNEVFLGMSYTHNKDYSEKTAAEIDEEVQGIMKNAYNSCYKLLSDNTLKLHNVAKALLAKEKLDGKEFEDIFSMETEYMSDEKNGDGYETPAITENAASLDEDSNKTEN